MKSKPKEITVETTYHPLGYMNKMFSKTRYIYRINKQRISLIHFNTCINGWAWELYGGKFSYPIQFKSKKLAEKEIEKRYKVTL